ncbi:helix-turn-helix transcriptional regulator [Pendulispora albinea]|uniref:Helix-turn-helix transcriptional regulator n=1 Tax=Pendulispora albinea TaxID=2741071 RepID=A0ABZ2M975_9BACT
MTMLDEDPFQLSDMLRRFRILRGMKQAHLAQLFRVSQSAVSKWENGTAAPSAEQHGQIIEILGAKPSAVRDTWLARLVESSNERVHAICDITHKLLIASPARYTEWGTDRHDMFNRPLLQDAPTDIVEAERRFLSFAHRHALEKPIVLKTEGQSLGRYQVEPGYLLWERLQLSDGTWVRLATSITAERIPKGAIAV